MRVAEADMEREAKRFIAGLRPRARATVIALSGDVGAGKTSFVKAMAQALGVAAHITSPTFVIMKIYELEGQRFERLIHMDTYRLKGVRHLEVLGWNALVADSRNLICIEWPERVAEALPTDVIRVTLRYSGEDAREIQYGPHAPNEEAQTISAA